MMAAQQAGLSTIILIVIKLIVYFYQIRFFLFFNNKKCYYDLQIILDLLNRDQDPPLQNVSLSLL